MKGIDILALVEVRNPLQYNPTTQSSVYSTVTRDKVRLRPRPAVFSLDLINKGNVWGENYSRTVVIFHAWNSERSHLIWKM